MKKQFAVVLCSLFLCFSAFVHAAPIRSEQGGVPWVNATSFGAKGDGVTNDSAAIIAAAASGSAVRVYLPAGTFLIGTGITLQSNHSYIGAGVGLTTLKLTNGMAVAGAFGGTAPLSNIEIADMTIDGNKANNPQDGFALIGMGATGQTAAIDNVSLHDLVLKNSTEYCIGLEGGTFTNVHISNVTMDGCDRDGLDIKSNTDGNNGIFIDNVHVSRFGLSEAGGQTAFDIRGKAVMNNIRVNDVHGTDTGIRFNREAPAAPTGSTGSSLSNFQIYGTNVDTIVNIGLYIRSESISISNGYIFGTSYGVYVESAVPMKGTLISNVSVEGTRNFAFLSQGSNDKGTGISNCNATNNIGNGFFLIADQARLVNSLAADNGGTGIWVSSAAVDPIVLGNTVFNNTIHDFKNDSSTTHASNNVGIKTRNSGTATITAAVTSVVVTHGLFSTPLIADISITLNTNTTNDIVRAWVSNVTSTQFTVNVGAAPGASTAVFAWQASVLN